MDGAQELVLRGLAVVVLIDDEHVPDGLGAAGDEHAVAADLEPGDVAMAAEQSRHRLQRIAAQGEEQATDVGAVGPGSGREH